MSPEALATVLIGSAALGLILGYIIGKTRADGIAFDERDAARRERDAALQAKSAQFEEWQADTARLRREIAELRDGQAQAFTALNKAQRELSLLRPIADAAEKLLDDEKLPGEWAPVRAAIRARKEAQS